MLVELAFLGTAILISPMLAWALVRRRRMQGNWRVALTASLPLPALLFVAAIVIFVTESQFRAKGCEPGVCDLMRGLGLAGFILAPILYIVGFGFAWGGIFLARRVDRLSPDVDRIFE